MKWPIDYTCGIVPTLFSKRDRQFNTTIIVHLPPLTPPLTYTLIHCTSVQKWRELERNLLVQKLLIPVYFAIEDTTLSHIHGSLTSTAEQEKGASVTASECNCMTSN